MVSAILLAAGESKRMGRPKQLLLVDGQPIVVQSLRNLIASQVDEVILVLGYYAELILAEVQRYFQKGFKIVVNPYYREGMSRSLQEGLKQVNKESEAVLIALADQPFVETQSLNKIIQAYHNTPYGIIVPTYGGRRGNPVLLSLKYRQEMESLTGDVGCREILKRYREDILEVEVDSPGILKDIDTPVDYQSL
ncbi:MAG TPA: molybdenum cofactor cytidylyltransferase [Candidatus Limnocylindrales bacterium]|nr:molybdenum cofactor cytidylyltransferase [Candidatus Limnocylindrales bacterium]